MIIRLFLTLKKPDTLSMLKLCVKQSANILNGWSTTPNRALAAFWLKMSAENDPQYARLFKRFYGRLTTSDRLEYEKRIENYLNQP